MIDGLRPYAEMKDSGVPWIGAVPAHWAVQRIKTLFRENETRNENNAGGVLLSLTRAKGILPQAEASNKLASTDDLSKYKICRRGDLVMNRMQAWSGMFAMSEHDGVVSPDYSVFAQLGNTSVKFFEILFKTPMFVDQFARSSKGIGSGFNRLYTPDFGAIQALVPSTKEQVAIVRFLDHADRRIRRAIAAKQKLIKLLEEQKQAIIHRAVTRGLDSDVRLKPSGVEWLGDVPEHWGVSKIRYFARVGNGSTPSRGRADYWGGGTFPWLNSSVANHAVVMESDQFVTQIALRECHLPVLQPGSVLVAITGQGKTRGKAALLEMEATINQHLAYISIHDERVTPTFLRSVLTASYTTLRSISDDSGSTKGALTCADLRHFKVPVPPLIEQAALVDWIGMQTSSADDVIDRAEREISLLREYRTRLIADVVTGKLDVREAAARLPDEVDVAGADLEEIITEGVEDIDGESEEADTEDIAA